MKRKLQIFVSSTYHDLLSERQAAVEAILRAGHIPAGMELFAAGDKSQLETIYRWIDESDVYMLILGGRYGSIESDSDKAYIQLEYERAIDTGKHVFAVVLTEGAIDVKVRAAGKEVIENENPKKLEAFRKVVKSKICRMVDDAKDIKLAIHETILEFLREYKFDGWVSGKNLAGNEELGREVARLTLENARLKADLASTKVRNVLIDYSEADFDAILSLLNNEYLEYTLGDGDSATAKSKPYKLTAAGWFLAAKNEFVTGIANSYGMSSYRNFLYFRVSPLLSMHGLTEDQAVPGVRWQRIKTTKKGNAFLVYLQKIVAKRKKASPPKHGHPK